MDRSFSVTPLTSGDQPVPERPSDGPTPICKCGATNRHARHDDRCANGHLLAGNATALTHGLYSERVRAASDDPEALRAMAEQRIQLLRELGSVGVVPTMLVNRITEFDCILNRTGEILKREGPLTAKGHLRGVFNAHVKGTETLIRLAQLLGFERPTKTMQRLLDSRATKAADLSNLSDEQMLAKLDRMAARLRQSIERKAARSASPPTTPAVEQNDEFTIDVETAE